MLSKNIIEMISVQRKFDEEPLTNEDIHNLVVKSFEKQFNVHGASIVQDNKSFIEQAQIIGFENYSAKQLNELVIFEVNGGYSITEYNPIDNNFEVLEDTGLSVDKDMYDMFCQVSESIDNKENDLKLGIDR